MKKITLLIFLLVSFFCQAQPTLKEQLEYQKKTGIGLLITGGAFAHLSAAMFYQSLNRSECSRYTKTDFICAGAVLVATALPCIIVGSVNLGRNNNKSSQYNLKLTFKNSGANISASLNF